jgi:hypothetical protein
MVLSRSDSDDVIASGNSLSLCRHLQRQCPARRRRDRRAGQSGNAGGARQSLARPERRT